MADVEAASRVTEERPLGELLARLSRDVSLLVRQEVELAKREAAEKLHAFGGGASNIAIGGVICHLGALALTAALIMLLARALPGWLAALSVGVIYAAVGGVLLRRGAARLRELRLEPQKLAESLREDVKAIKEAVR